MGLFIPSPGGACLSGYGSIFLDKCLYLNRVWSYHLQPVLIPVEPISSPRVGVRFLIGGIDA